MEPVNQPYPNVAPTNVSPAANIAPMNIAPNIAPPIAPAPMPYAPVVMPYHHVHCCPCCHQPLPYQGYYPFGGWRW